MDRPLCRHCGCISTWHKQATGRGWRVMPWCARCWRHPTACAKPAQGHKTWVSISGFTTQEIASMPVKPGYEEACDVCGTVAPIELHHLAPRALYGDACELWPTTRICAPCHDGWHAKVWRA